MIALTIVVKVTIKATNRPARRANLEREATKKDKIASIKTQILPNDLNVKSIKIGCKIEIYLILRSTSERELVRLSSIANSSFSSEPNTLYEILFAAISFFPMIIAILAPIYSAYFEMLFKILWKCVYHNIENLLFNC